MEPYTNFGSALGLPRADAIRGDEVHPQRLVDICLRDPSRVTIHGKTPFDVRAIGLDDFDGLSRSLSSMTMPSHNVFAPADFGLFDPRWRWGAPHAQAK